MSGVNPEGIDDSHYYGTSEDSGKWDDGSVYLTADQIPQHLPLVLSTSPFLQNHWVDTRWVRYVVV